MLNQNNYPSLDDPAPRAVRWATKMLQREFTPAWSKWHLTDGNGSFTACGVRVVPFIVDGSPQERDPNRLTCRRCAAVKQEAEQLAQGWLCSAESTSHHQATTGHT